MHWILMVERSDEHEPSIDALPPILDRLHLHFDEGRRITTTPPPIEIPYTLHPDERRTDAVVAPTRLGLVINETVKAVFDSLDIGNVQHFPARLRELGTDEVTEEYWIANVVGSVACVDHERSDLLLFDDGDIEFIDKLVLEPSAAPEHGHIFRLAEFPPVLVISDDLKRSLERADDRARNLPARGVLPLDGIWAPGPGLPHKIPSVMDADELRTTVGDDIPASERRQRRHDADDWEYYEHRARLKQAILFYDSIEATRENCLASAH